MADNDSKWEDVCWICLQSSTDCPRSTPLIYPCACPRPVHESCLARWQLHCAGREEESCCRFCKKPLPHWRQAFKASSSSQRVQVAPLMSIQFHGQTYWLQVRTGDGGVEQFKADVKRLLDLSSEDNFDITFECQVPGDGDKLELHGLESFDAAVYCASLTAAERLAAAAPSTPEAGTATADTGSQADTNPPQEGKASAPDVARPVVASAAADGTAMAVGFSSPEGPSSRTSSSSGNSSGSSTGRSRASSSSGSSSSSSLVTAYSVDMSVEAAAVGGTGPSSTLHQTWSGASSSSHSAPHDPTALSACSNSRRMAAAGGRASIMNKRGSRWAAATNAWHWAVAKLVPKAISAPARAAAAAGQQSASC